MKRKTMEDQHAFKKIVHSKCYFSNPSTSYSMKRKTMEDQHAFKKVVHSQCYFSNPYTSYSMQRKTMEDQHVRLWKTNMHNVLSASISNSIAMLF